MTKLALRPISWTVTSVQRARTVWSSSSTRSIWPSLVGDNAMCESFFTTLDCELVDRGPQPRRRQCSCLRIHRRFYNARQPSAECLSPTEYERRYRQAASTEPEGSSTHVGRLSVRIPDCANYLRGEISSMSFGC